MKRSTVLLVVMATLSLGACGKGVAPKGGTLKPGSTVGAQQTPVLVPINLNSTIQGVYAFQSYKCDGVEQINATGYFSPESSIMFGDSGAGALYLETSRKIEHHFFNYSVDSASAISFSRSSTATVCIDPRDNSAASPTVPDFVYSGMGFSMNSDNTQITLTIPSDPLCAIRSGGTATVVAVKL